MTGLLKNKKASLILCILVCALSLALSTVLAINSNALFDTNVSGTQIIRNQTSEIDNRNGVLLKANDDATFSISESLSGDFDIELRALPETVGTADFSELTISLVDVETKLGVDLKLYANVSDETVSYRYSFRMTHPDKAVSLSKAVWKSDTSLDGTKNVTRFSFDTDTYVIGYYENGQKVVGAKLTDENDLAGMGTRTACSGFENYSVSISVSGVEANKTAKVIVYSLNGQSLAGETFTNQVGAVLAQKPKFSNGVLGEEYSIEYASLKTCDVIDGEKSEFSGVITAEAPSGTKTDLTNGKFTPQEVGEYKLHFKAKDLDGIFGEVKTYEFFVYGYHPESTINLAFPIDDVLIGKGAKVVIPSAEATSELTLNDEPMEVLCKLYLGETEIKSFDARLVNEYTLTENGAYNIVYQTTDALGKSFVENYNLTVTDGVPIITLDGVFPSAQVLNSTVKIPSATSSNDNAVSLAVYYPDGRSVSSSCIKADVYGTYLVKYTVQTADGYYSFNRYFNVERTSESLWVNVKGTEIAGNVASPEYSAAELNGVMIKASRENATVNFANPIDISDNKKTDNLIEFFISPEINTIAEFTGLKITLTDINDENNYFAITFEKDNYGDLYVIRPSVQTNKSKNSFNYGLLGQQQSIRGSYSGMFTRLGTVYPANTVSLHFDYQTLTLYSSLENTSSNIYRKIAKLDDTELVGKGNEWRGFSSGKAYLSVTFTKVNSAKAHLMVLDVDGQSMSGAKVKDITPPSIDVDYRGNEENALPKGLVGKDYPIFKATATDLIEGACNAPQIKIYQLVDGVKNRVYEHDYETFTPEKTGQYLIEYTASDGNGNVAVKSVAIEVVSELDELSFDFDGIAEEVYIGSYVAVPEGKASGGSGTISVTKKVYFGQDEVEFIDGEFFVEKIGEYTVKVTLQDYLGVQQNFEKKVTVLDNDKPVFVKTTVPKAVMTGREIFLKGFSAYEYNDNVRQDVSVTVTVNGKVVGESGYYVFETVGEYTVEYRAESNKGTNVDTYTVYALTAEEDKAMYLSNYFLAENLSVSGGDTNLVFTATANEAKINFARSVSAVEFLLSFNVLKDNNALGGVRVTLVDSVNPDEVLAIEVLKGEENATTSTVNINDGTSKEIVGSFFGTTVNPFTIKYDNESFEICDYQDNVLTVLDKVNGKAWKGFSSEKVFVEIEFIDCVAGSAISISDLNNQTFSKNTKKDRIAPQIFYQAIDKVMNFGDTLNIKSAKAFDVLGEVVSFTLTVTSPSGNVILDAVDARKTYSITFSEFGEYYLRYKAEDDSGRNVTRSVPINIKNKQVPTITLNGSVQEGAGVGKAFKLPSATLEGSDSVRLYVTVIAPNGYMTVLDGLEYTPNAVGNHKIIYYAVDDYGNSAQQTFYISVK